MLVEAEAQIQSLAGELPYAVNAALKKKNLKKKKRREDVVLWGPRKFQIMTCSITRHSSRAYCTPGPALARGQSG